MSRLQLFWIISAIVTLSLVFACHKLEKKGDESQIVVVEVFGKELFESELNNIIHPSISSFDSTSIANAYIDQWIKDQLLMREATQFISSDLEIEKLVDDYRGKLIKFNFEEKILAERYDTIISEEEMQKYYEEHKGRFLLDQAIFRCIFAKISDKTKRIDKFNSNWVNSNFEEILLYLEKNSEEYKMDREIWYTWNDISSWSDVFLLNRAKKRKNLQKHKNGFEFFLKVVEFKDKNEISPVAFISDRLKQIILHQRKQKIIEDYKQELYEGALEKNIIHM